MTLIVDNSILAAVAACPSLAAIRYVLHRAAEDGGSAPMRAGTAVHEALGAFFATSGDRDAALVALRASYLTWAQANVPADDRLGFANVQRIVERWMEVHPPGAWPFVIPDPAYVERPFQVALTDGIDFVGRMDALGTDPAQGWWVVEVKTTGRLDERWARRWRMASQVTGYTWGAGEALGRTISGCFVLGIEMAKLPDDPKRKCKTHGVAYLECGALHAKFEMRVEPRAPHQLAAWRGEAERLARTFAALTSTVTDAAGVAALSYQGLFNGTCSECAYRDFCAMGRPAAFLETMTREERWDPLEHARVRAQ